MTSPTTDDRRPTTASGMFVRVEVDDVVAGDAAAAKQLASVCPVDIFADDGGRVVLVEDNVSPPSTCELRTMVVKLRSSRLLTLIPANSDVLIA